MPLDPVNPYGSFYDFYSLRQASQQYSVGNLGLDSSLASSIGQGFGNNFPSGQEFYALKMSQMRNTSLMMEALKADPRAGAASDFLTRSMYGNDQRGIDKFYESVGGVSNFRGGLSTFINMPGISGFMRGDVRSLMFGAQAISGGGVRINGQSSYGQNLAQEAMAKQLFNSVQSNFYTSTGADRLSMTSGLDRNQLGGLMGIAASQGAFSGLDMGKVASMRQGGTQGAMTPQAGEQIKEFVKTAAKSMATLIDVFGNQDMGTLANIAQKITGLDLSSMKNVEAMKTRLMSIKTTAATMGIDTGTAFQGTIQMGNFGMYGLGQSEYVARNMASVLAPQAMMQTRFQQGDPGYFMRPMSFSEVGTSLQTDVAGMLRDPRGSRAALVEFMAQSGSLSGGSLDNFRKMAAGLTPGASVGAFDAQFHKLTGFSAESRIAMMGGGAGIMERLGPNFTERVKDQLLDQHALRQDSLIHAYAGRLFSNAGLGNNAADLFTTFDKGTLNSMAGAADSGGGLSAIADIAMTDPGFSMDRDTATGFAKKVMSLKGLFGGAQSSIQELTQTVARMPFSNNFRSASMRGQQTRLQTEAQTLALTAEQERWMNDPTQSGVQGFLEAMGPDSPKAHAAMVLRFRRGQSDDSAFGYLGSRANMFLDPNQGYTDGRGILTDAGRQRFASTLDAMPNDMKNAMGIVRGDVDGSYQSRFADPAQKAINLQRAFDTFKLNMSSPEARFKLMKGFYEVKGSKGESALVRTSAAENQVESDQQAAVADVLGEALTKEGKGFAGTDGVSGKAGFYNNLARALVSGKSPGLHGGIVDSKDDKALLTRLEDSITADTMLNGISADDARKIAGLSTSMGQKAIDRLTFFRNDLDQQSHFNASAGRDTTKIDELITRVDNRITQFKSGMKSTPAGGDGMRLSGSVELIPGPNGNGRMDFSKVFLKQ